MRRIAPVMAAPEPSFYERRAARVHRSVPRSGRFALRLAAATGDGIFVPMGFEYAARNGFDAAMAAPEDMDALARRRRI